MKAIRMIGPILGLAAALAVTPVAANAFGLSGAGGRLGITTPENVDGTLTYGGHLEFEEPGSRWHIVPSLLAWSEDGISDVNPNFDMYYHFDPQTTVTPYLGAGLGVHMYDFRGGNDTDIGANLLGGVRFPMNASHLFVEGRYAMTDLSQFGVQGGVTFHLR